MAGSQAEYREELGERDDIVCSIEYYMLQLAPAQWVAVGRPATRPDAAGPRPLLVGTGRTEDAAVMDLLDRCPHGHPVASVIAQPEEHFA